jgi:hypothetical protein
MECSLDHWSIPSEIADCITMTKWMFSFVNCCECKSPIYSGILIMKSNEMHYFSDLFDKVHYIFRTCPLSSIRNISTLYTRSRYLLLWFCWLSSSVVNTPSDRQWTCPKHVAYFTK